MQRSSVTRQPSASLIQPRWYPDDLLPQLQETLAALADIEFRHEIDQERLDAFTGPEEAKRRLLEQLEERRQQERGPLVQRLAELHQRMMNVAAFQEICLTS
jgi:hypothetical protein